MDSKALEALKRIKKVYELFVKARSNEELNYAEKQDFETIEKELALSEQLKNAVSDGTLQNQWASNLIEKQNAKKLKALEIIKEKEVNVQDFKICLENEWDYELFERFCQDNAPFAEDVAYVHPMTEEELELLKEVLKDE